MLINATIQKHDTNYFCNRETGLGLTRELRCTIKNPESIRL